MIEIIIDIKDYGWYGSRLWPAVPRKGDYISLEGEKAGIYEIDDVLWTQDGNKNLRVVLIIKECNP